MSDLFKRDWRTAFHDPQLRSELEANPYGYGSIDYWLYNSRAYGKSTEWMCRATGRVQVIILSLISLLVAVSILKMIVGEHV